MSVDFSSSVKVTCQSPVCSPLTPVCQDNLPISTPAGDYFHGINTSLYSQSMPCYLPAQSYSYFYTDPAVCDSTSVDGCQNYSYAPQVESYYIHAPAPIFPTQDTILQSHCSASALDGVSLGEFSPNITPQTGPPLAIHAPQLYSQPGALLHQNGTSLSPFTFPTPSARLPDHANNASSVHHECSADPRPLTTRIRPVLKLNEIRRRRADRRKAKVIDVSSVLPFQATDPDTISSHEKKRLYVGGLEEYVVWMERQVRLVGKEPRPMQNIKAYKGICSRSLRTMLAHFQNEADKLHAELESQERKFLELQSQVLHQEVADVGFSHRRSSVTTDSCTSDSGLL